MNPLVWHDYYPQPLPPSSTHAGYSNPFPSAPAVCYASQQTIESYLLAMSPRTAQFPQTAIPALFPPPQRNTPESPQRQPLSPLFLPNPSITKTTKTLSVPRIVSPRVHCHPCPSKSEKIRSHGVIKTTRYNHTATFPSLFL